MTTGTSRRAVLAGLLAASSPARADSPAPRIVALEWSLVALLLTLGIAPVGMGEPDGYRVWVGEPPLPPGIADVGIRNEPNLEALAALKPDLILVSPLSAAIVPLIRAIAPVREIALYGDGRDPIAASEEALITLGAEYGRAEATERTVAEGRAAFAALRAGLAGPVPPLCVVNMVDERHVRAFGEDSLFAAALGRLGLANAWPRPGNPWGFELAGLPELARLPSGAGLVVVEPLPPGVRLDRARPSLWSSLPAVRDGRLAVLPAAWPFGELTAALRFARALSAALLGPAGAGFRVG